jgi:Zn-finger nucleic acid-binding protein
VRLVACRNCHTQYDVTSVVDAEIPCRCGAKVENRSFDGLEVSIHRCGSCGAQVGADASACEYCSSEIVRDDARLSLICPECFGRNVEESRYCTGCGVAFLPQQVEVDGVELPCPVCACLMPVRAVGGVGINECPQCNGIWAPDNRFDHLIAQACEAARKAGPGASLTASARRQGGNPYSAKVVYRKCPVCDAHMQRSNFQKRSGVIVDRCHEHGTWLDADELEQIAGFILEGGLGADGARGYAMKSELDSMRRREAAALARAIKGESMTIESAGARSGNKGFLSMLLKELLD